MIFFICCMYFMFSLRLFQYPIFLRDLKNGQGFLCLRRSPFSIFGHVEPSLIPTLERCGFFEGEPAEGCCSDKVPPLSFVLADRFCLSEIPFLVRIFGLVESSGPSQG